MTHQPLRIGFGVTALGIGSARDELDGIGYYTQELGGHLQPEGTTSRPISLATPRLISCSASR